LNERLKVKTQQLEKYRYRQIIGQEYIGASLILISNLAWHIKVIVSCRMCFEDFLANFEIVWICHLEPDAVSREIAMAKVAQLILYWKLSVCTCKHGKNVTAT
jgi:hypothetical protein